MLLPAARAAARDDACTRLPAACCATACRRLHTLWGLQPHSCGRLSPLVLLLIGSAMFPILAADAEELKTFRVTWVTNLLDEAGTPLTALPPDVCTRGCCCI